MSELQPLRNRHQALRAQHEDPAAAVNLQAVKDLLAEVRRVAAAATDPEAQEAYHDILEAWRPLIRAQTGAELEDAIPLPEAPQSGIRATQRKPLPLWVTILGGTLAIIILTTGIAAYLTRGFKNTIAALPASPSQLNEELATDLLSFTPLPDRPTATASALQPTPLPPTPTLTPTPIPTLTPPTDPPGDAAGLIDNAVVANPPVGVDIAGCNVSSDTTVLAELTAPLAITITDEQLVIWITLQEPVPETRALDYHFLVALDVDANPHTGRPAGAGYINPELGTEIGAGVFLYPDGELEPYIYIWSAALGDWSGDTPDIVTATLSPERDAAVLTFPLAELQTAVADIAGVTLSLDTLRGRTGVIASSDTTAAIVDYCPDLP